MITALLYDNNPKEVKDIKNIFSDGVAHLSDDRLEIYDFNKPESVQDYIEENELLDAACVEIAGKEDTATAKKLREKYEDTSMLVVADLTVSPMEYMNPSIRATSLLLRPYAKEVAQQVIFEFLKSMQIERKQETNDNFVLKNQDGDTVIPFSKIYYFEIRDKKVIVQLKNQSYSRYGTLEQLEKELPEQFMRCHRSFIVNMDYLSRVKLSEGLIYLIDDITVPLSRSYKAAIKEYVHGR